MYSNLRKKLSQPSSMDHPSYFVGVIIKGIQLPHPNHGHVVFAKPSPILFYPISPNEIRCAELSMCVFPGLPDYQASGPAGLSGVWDTVDAVPP